VITRLARPHASGGFVIGQGAILAEGADFAALKAWILAHGGAPQAPPPSGSGRGLYGSARMAEHAAPASRSAPRYVLPASARS